MNQDQFDETISEAKTLLALMLKESGCKTMQLAIVHGKNKKDIQTFMAFYELEVFPAVKKAGLEHPTLAELMGCEVTLTEVKEGE